MVTERAMIENLERQNNENKPPVVEVVEISHVPRYLTM
jgi:hypothetical protein